MNIKYVAAKNYTKADRKSIDLVVVHTAECAEVSSAAENLQAWTAGPNANPSSWHYAVDNDSITQSCLEKDIAWHAGPVNGYSIGIEHAGRASQDAAGWADDYSKAVLENSAKLTAEICGRYGIPVVRLTAENLRAGERRGITGHVDVTNGLTGGKGHQDPGKAFPWDSWLARVNELVRYEPRNPSLPAIPPALAFSASRDFVEIEHAGVTWEVCPVYIGPVGIGQARDLAAQFGCELPTPDLVDAIWRAADLKIDAAKMVFSAREGNDFGARMFAPETFALQNAKLVREVGERSLGIDYRLIAGAFKDVVQRRNPSTGELQIGLYGWHRPDGTAIQPFFSGHAAAWIDYSQGLRLVRRKA